MYNLLVFIGFCLIIWGVYVGKKPIDHEETIELKEILLRIENIENTITKYEPTLEEEEIEFEDVLDLVSSQIPEEKYEDNNDESEVFNVIGLLKDGKYSLADACRILDMNKGEVLLLKNLYKKSQS